jgi:hypothetical protein
VGELWPAVATALLAALVYLNALHNPFVYDDYHTVVENPSTADVTNIRAVVMGALTRPIVNLSYAVDRALWGSQPFGFHLTNLLLHALNVFLLFHLARRFDRSALAAFGAASLFAVHPMMTEAVGYISGRSEVLCATFFMLALMSGQRWVRGGAGWGVTTVGLWLAALATKETAAMFPFVFLASDWFSATAAGDRRRRLWRIHLPLLGTTVVAGVIRLVVLARIEYPGQVAVHWDYLLLAIDVARRYVWMLLVPSGQALFHEVAPVGLADPRAWVGILVIGGGAAFALRMHRIDWVASAGILWFLLLLVPSAVLTVLDQGEPMAEHRVYVASGGFFLAAGTGIGRLGGLLSRRTALQRVAATGVFAVVLASFAFGTVFRNAVWADPIQLWQESVDLAPTHPRPRLLLGEALEGAGLRDEALAEYQKAIDLRPADPTGHLKAGHLLATLGRWAEARRHFVEALALDPHNPAAGHSLALLDEIASRFGIDSRRP